MDMIFNGMLRSLQMQTSLARSGHAWIMATYQEAVGVGMRVKFMQRA